VQLPGFLSVHNVDKHHLERYLLPQEKHSVTIRRHPALLMRYIGETIGGAILAGALSTVFTQSGVRIVLWVGWLLIVSRLAYKVFEWTDEFFAVTKVRVIFVHGIFTRRVDMMPLTKITDLAVNRSILGRMLGYGTIVLESAGQDQALSKLEFVPEPESMYLEISTEAFGHDDDD
jgi:uncharacterized membrane protein YdbT with pleckstrin-like domain